MTHNHAKNGYAKVLGIIFLIMIVLAVVAVLYVNQIIVPNVPWIPSIHHNSQPVTLDYTNDEYRFGVTFDKTYTLDTSGDQPNNFKTGGKTTADIAIPQSAYPNTNYGSGHITFAVKTKSSASDCQIYNNKTMTKTVSLNVGKFYTTGTTGAAAGTMYDTNIYRIYDNDICYEAGITIGIANIGNYEPGTVTAVNETDVWNKLSAILASFRFSSLADQLISSSDGILTGHITVNSAPSPDAYDSINILIYSQDRKTILAKGTVDTIGNYQVSAPPATYYVTYSSVYNQYQPPMKKIILSTAETTTQDFTIDTGR